MYTIYIETFSKPQSLNPCDISTVPLICTRRLKGQHPHTRNKYIYTWCAAGGRLAYKDTWLTEFVRSSAVDYPLPHLRDIFLQSSFVWQLQTSGCMDIVSYSQLGFFVMCDDKSTIVVCVCIEPVANQRLPFLLMFEVRAK